MVFTVWLPIAPMVGTDVEVIVLILRVIGEASLKCRSLMIANICTPETPQQMIDPRTQSLSHLSIDRVHPLQRNMLGAWNVGLPVETFTPQCAMFGSRNLEVWSFAIIAYPFALKLYHDDNNILTRRDRSST